MNIIVDRNTSGRALGFVAGVVAVASVTAFLLVDVSAIRSDVQADVGAQSTDQKPQTTDQRPQTEDATPSTLGKLGENIEMDSAVAKSSFEAKTDSSGDALRDLLILVQVELFLAEADLTVPMEASEEHYRVEEDKIYYGNAKKFQKPCVIEAQKVYDSIASYQKIIENGFTKDSPEYWPLMRKAASTFVRALKSVCKEGKFDLVGEIGAIACQAREVPEVTKDVLKRITDAK